MTKTRPSTPVTRTRLLLLSVVLGLAGLPTLASSAQADFQFAGEWGSMGTADGQLLEPEGIAVNPSTGEVYVADSGNHRIQRFTAKGAFLGRWGGLGSGDGQFERIWDVAVNTSSGDVYVSSGHVYSVAIGGAWVQRFSATGTFLGAWGEEDDGSGVDRLRWPHGIDVNPSNGEVYVADDGHYVKRFSAVGEFRSWWGGPGAGDGQFTDDGDPPRLAFNSSSGEVYVTDDGNGRIQRFSAVGEFRDWWHIASVNETWIDTPTEVAVNTSNGEVYVADSAHGIQRFSPTGTFLGRWGGEGTGSGEFKHPAGIAINPSTGEVYVADRFNHRIQRFRPPEPVPPAPDTDQGGDVTIRILGKRLAMNRKRVVRTRLRCPASVQAPPCRGRLVLRTAKKVRFGSKRRNVRLARTRFAIGGGKAQRARARLNRPRARLVRRNKRARTVRVIVRVRDQAGNSARVVKRMRLRSTGQG